ncbi:recombinase family protein [Lactobacillus sp. MRS-253-APC-2B]|uniref:recombinase family protein n=1 Tax=Lactobacillus sp. MRS-253-APC-2B TaxID=2725305 RepID=UPI00146E4A0C|nr:recombinase family protein [Lactobacillus sp. MRS-253-APC-2B]NME34929.1 recombinase family protein [Lactobacillus sp. MRS-253-APC-2B]
MIYGYARVSGTGQDLELQMKELEQEGVPAENIYAEKFTGTTQERPKWNELYDKLQKGDTVYFTKVDRIGRTVRVAVDIVSDLLSKGVKVYIVQLGGYVDNSTLKGKLMFNMLSVMAEFEHDLIVERLATGKAYAKKHNPNYKEGRPKRRITNRYKRIYEYSLTHSIRETALTTGVSESTVKRIKRQIRESEKAND